MGDAPRSVGENLFVLVVFLVIFIFFQEVAVFVKIFFVLFLLLVDVISLLRVHRRWDSALPDESAKPPVRFRTLDS